MNVGELKMVTFTGPGGWLAVPCRLRKVRVTLSTRVVVTSSGVYPCDTPPLISWRPPMNDGTKYCQLELSSSRRRNMLAVLVRLRSRMPVELSVSGCRLVF